MIRNNLSKLVLNTANKHFGTNIEQAKIEYPRQGFGDFSCNIAFELSKILGRSPIEIAKEIAPLVEAANVDRVEAAGSGYLNIFMTHEFWLESLHSINAGYLENNLGKGIKMQVEFISANPTGPLTLANARGGFLGDVLSNVFEVCGYEVTREYYINDGGGQITKLVDSLKAEAGSTTVKERQYTGEYIKELSAKLKPLDYEDDAKLAADVVSELVDGIKRAVKILDINFDVWFSEISLVDDGTTEEVIDLIKKSGLLYERDNALWISSSDFGDERDRVLVKSDGSYTYLLNDIAYHYNIFIKRKFTRSIKLWGADHAGQVESLRLTLGKIAPEAKLDFILIQFVRLLKDGKELKMSKRAGTYVTIDELIESLEGSVGKQYAPSVARWFFLMRASDNRVDFDLNLASKQSQQNPYFYVTYAYARAHSILHRAKERGMVPSNGTDHLDESGIAITSLMSRFQELVIEVSQDYGAHKLIFFGMELSKAFQHYYESERIIDLDKVIAEKKLYFIQQYIIFMDQYWALLGINPVKKLTEK
jgi:arginyl-tRNA synthetase